MGFFSRLFNLDDKNSGNKQEAKDSELTIDAKTAAAVLAEIDIDTAIAAHENWKLRLRNYLDGKSTEQLSPDVVCLDDRCDLGKWLHGPGGQRLGKYPAFTMLIARHKYFHVQASTVVALTQAGEKAKAEETLKTNYEHGSTQTVLLLKELKRALQR
jgi:Chemoreceptor zinc-binding domain